MYESIMTAISTVGFPIVMCGALCYYIVKVQNTLVTAINENTKAIAALIGFVKDEEVKHNEKEQVEES